MTEYWYPDLDTLISPIKGISLLRINQLITIYQGVHIIYFSGKTDFWSCGHFSAIWKGIFSVFWICSSNPAPHSRTGLVQFWILMQSTRLFLQKMFCRRNSCLFVQDQEDRFATCFKTYGERLFLFFFI